MHRITTTFNLNVRYPLQDLQQFGPDFVRREFQVQNQIPTKLEVKRHLPTVSFRDDPP